MEEVLAQFVIPIQPVTKKNSPRVIRCGNYYKVLPSAAYIKYEETASQYVKLNLWRGKEPLECHMNIQAVYYMKSRNRVDLTNLHEGLHDMLVGAGVIADDSFRYVVSTDGSYVDYDKDNPRTEVIITKTIQRFENGKEWKPKTKRK